MGLEEVPIRLLKSGEWWDLDCLTEGYEAVMIRPPWLFGPENTMGQILEPVVTCLTYTVIDSVPKNCSNDDLPDHLLLWTHPSYFQLAYNFFGGWGYSKPYSITWYETQEAPSEFRHDRERDSANHSMTAKVKLKCARNSWSTTFHRTLLVRGVQIVRMVETS